MRKLSLMTINILGQMFFKFQMDQGLEEFADTYEEMMELVAETGYEAVDVTGIETQILTTAKVKEILAANHLAVSSYIYMDQFAEIDDTAAMQHINNGKAAVDTAKELGTKVLMLVPFAQSNVCDYTPEQLRGQLVKCFLPITAYAKEQGIHVVVEDTPDLRLHFCRLGEVKEVMDAVPGLELVYDSGNMLLVGEDPVEYYDALADKTAHIHLKDMRYASAEERFADTAEDGTTKMTGAPTGTGMVDLKTLMEHVRAKNYDGYLTVEFALDVDGDYRKSLIRSREYLEKML